MDSFAQTGGQQDDLFDDLASGEESMQTRAQDDLFGDDFTPISEEQAQAEVQSQQHEPVAKSRGDFPGGRGRGRGRGGRGPQVSGERPHQPQDTSGRDAGSGKSAATRTIGLLDSRHAPKPQAERTEQAEDTTPASEPPSNAPTAPRITKTTSVRGDRLATGGAARTKLTEEELAARMESIRLKNESLEAAHARAQADAESFAARESEAAQRRQVERRDRQQMMGEREKNRLRKLKAQEGREWDSEKREEDFAESNRRGYGRGAHGGIAGTRLGGNRGGRTADEVENDGREYLYREERTRGRGRGPRGGEGRGARGGAHGGKQDVPRTDDFPVLRGTNGTKEGGTISHTEAPVLTFPSQQKASKEESSGGAPELTKDMEKGEQSWADIVEESKA